GRWIGLTPRHISLSLFGGVTVFDREPGTPGQAWALALAGPVANLLVAVVAGIDHVVLVDAGADPLAAAAAASIVVINLGITLVNLIPALPLDGGHAARAVLGVVLRRPDIAGAIADAIGRALGWTMVGVESASVPPCRRAIRSTVTSPSPARPGFLDAASRMATRGLRIPTPQSRTTSATRSSPVSAPTVGLGRPGPASSVASSALRIR